ncbi:kinase-like domain-containing protein [Rhizophagus irregularis DAOM 181602=DAOM 197198]|nr:kinase-like domain-containing protein [Rhizophagus irregularis DAOM 181602=DAOM 197198]POG79122.1 kinase-like domain-containing protein [Rhizophagus irregularis DAOM 181602=DAOM 197198]|eukprot:XP_025185988.1 kinase-like domain-containing protein [Rhizophagus irregularis DAOM 181602=DAOM 197198]
MAKEIVNEIKLQHEMDFHENIIRFYGITTTENQSDNSKKYLLVLEYADSGTLRSYLNERFEELSWNDKLDLAFQLTNAISYLHDQEIVHRDLNSNDILVHKNTIKLSDFGLSKRIKESYDNQSKLFEMVAYVDPQIFNKKSDSNNQYQYSLNKKSDIYSIGILLWEISSGRPPFCNESYDVDLAMKILQGLRETPIPNTPDDYVMTYTDCWNDKPENRPTINQVVTKLNTVIIMKLSSEQQLKSNDNLLHGETSQILQNFNKINTNEIEPSISSNMNNFGSSVNEIIHCLEKVEIGKKKIEAYYYFNSHNITSQEIYYWLLDNQNDVNSIFLLGLFNQYGIEIGIDKEKAFELYQIAANLGNEFGVTSLGNCYLYGIGTIVNKNKAFELYQEAAKLGNPRGISNLGYCYFYGVGTLVNLKKSVELFQEAANLGNTNGICNLGHCYLRGIGTVSDHKKAFALFQKAANLGNELAQYYLALMYEIGHEVEKDINQAIYWYKKAAEQGHKHAQIKLIELSLLYIQKKSIKQMVKQIYFV